MTAAERNELAECASAIALGCDDWYTRGRYLELTKRGYTRICPRCKCCVMRADDSCYMCDGPKAPLPVDGP